MTYEGSTTHPGCWESTVWIILNKPIYITKQEVKTFSKDPISSWNPRRLESIGVMEGKLTLLENIQFTFFSTSYSKLYALRRLMQGSEHTPKAPLGNNARPLQPLHHRTVRTNIDFQHSSKVSQRVPFYCSPPTI